MDIWSLCCICNCNLFTYPAKTPHSRHSKRVIHIADIKLISWCLTQSKCTPHSSGLISGHPAGTRKFSASFQLSDNAWQAGRKTLCKVRYFPQPDLPCIGLSWRKGGREGMLKYFQYQNSDITNPLNCSQHIYASPLSSSNQLFLHHLAL